MNAKLLAAAILLAASSSAMSDDFEDYDEFPLDNSNNDSVAIKPEPEESQMTDDWWYCSDKDPDIFGSQPTIIKVTGDLETNIGIVSAAGTIQLAIYHIEGFDRTWNFGKSGLPSYMFVIKPNGRGLYYEFKSQSEAENGVKPSGFYYCHEKD